MQSRATRTRTYIHITPTEDVMPRLNSHNGFALVDTLVAMLLFAVLVLGAIATLMHGMHATHAAALTGRAVDLAADLLEQRRALPADAAVEPLLDAWNERLRTDLPPDAQGTALQLVQPLLTSPVPAP